jgi:small GTP-binding protein
MSKNPLIYKVVFIGESGVGKTSIINRYFSNKFSSELYKSTSAQFYRKEVFIKDYNRSIQFDIWDTAGITNYRNLAKIYYKDASTIILVYDITNKKSFEEIKNYWIKNIRENVSPDPSN